MQTFQPDNKIRTATLVGSHRITPDSTDEVRHLIFRAPDPEFSATVGSCIRVLAPGQFGTRHHARIYSIMDVESSGGGTHEFAICVRRCHYVDDFSGERYPGVASNFLCDRKAGESIDFIGPVSYPFVIPDDKTSPLLMIGMGTGIAPFRGLVRQIYEKLGGWEGRVRLFFGARNGLEMLYLNDENRDLSLYFDQPTFRAFLAVSPRPALDAPVALDQVIEKNAGEVWDMLRSAKTHVFVAGTEEMWPMVDKALVAVAGSADAWYEVRKVLNDEGRWHSVLY